MGNDSKDSDASAPDSSSDDSNSPPAPPAKSGSSSSTPPPEKSSPSPPSSPPPSPPSSPPPSPPSSPPPSPQIQSPPPAPPSADQRSPPAPSGGSASVSPPVNKPPPTLPTTPAVPDSHRKPTPSGSVPASRGGGSSSSSSLAPPDNQPSKGGSSNNTGLIAGVVVGVVFIIVIAGLCVAIFRRKKKKKAESQIWDSTYKYPDKYHAVSIPPMQGNLSSASYQGSGWPQPAPPPPPGPTSGFNYSTGVPQQVVSPGSSPAPMSSGGGHGQKSFSFDDLVAATNGFSSANMLGQGGFGFVHKGVLPTTGKVVAVKSLKSGSGQGEREFQSEVEIISRVHHRHLVSLVGYCISAAKRLLVYEFVPNNTLEFHLHQSGNVLDFSARLRIALGAAKGLAYLHEDCHPRIIHRDIKASNILLDYNFEAQVADFGLAKLTSDANTHVSTRVMGTFGYLAPEYASSGKLTEKSDVFSFGVMLLELITGRRPVDPNDYNMMEDSLVDWARPLLTKALADKNYDGLADPRLERNYDAQDMLSMVACAASSIRHSSRKRPRMSQIVRALEGQMSLDKLLEGGSKTTKSSDYDTAAYKADMSKFREIALGGDSSNDTSTNTSSEFNLHT